MDYKEKLEEAKRLYETANVDQRYVLESLFPELKESEDEKVRKALIEMVHDTTGDSLWIDYNVHKSEAIAWLEKQKGCEYIKKDWLEHIKQSWYKEGFIDGKYSNKTPKEWTINDAITLNELIDFLENGTAKLQHDLTKYANWLKIQFTPFEKQGEQKASCTTIVETGDSGINALVTKDIEIPFGAKDSELQEYTYYIPKGFHAEINDDNVVIKKGEQKPAWSEEDEKELNSCIEAIEACYKWDTMVDWLKSLKDRIIPQQKQEWSEEDEAHINGIIDYLLDYKLFVYEEDMNVANEVQKELDWLNSLKQRIGG